MESGLSGLPRGQVVVSEAVPWRPWLGQVESKPVMTEPTLTPLAWSGEDIQCSVKDSPYSKAHTLASTLYYQAPTQGLMTVDQEPIMLECLLIPSLCCREYKRPTFTQVFAVTWEGCTYENEVIVHTLGKHEPRAPIQLCKELEMKKQTDAAFPQNSQLAGP